ncbi:Cytochrome P450 3A31 [Rhizoctonia solani AG-1 IB]|uniref:Cytochrome P450 3A31 n=1 Tax=Thanatephorus cucumeris (strain AG1-IB / isolate 7/3/14) TaxID=1108050 RepID=M5C4U0_THACB|nr:Cytochrome P450 3A31 [Rhizoctonia solani AG-1 IB]
MTNTWSCKEATHIQDVDANITMQITLCVISKAGFGQYIEWGDDGEVPEGHKLTFKQSLFTVSQNFPILILVPKWAFGWNKHWAHVRDAYEEMRCSTSTLERTASTPDLRSQAPEPSPRITNPGVQVEEQHDLFNQLILAHDDSNSLSKEELLGNVFLFLFGGYETTAHSLCFALGLLATHPEEQRKVFEQIQELQKDHNDFSYEDLPKYTNTLAVFYETLRLYPIGPELPRCAGSNATLTYTPHHAKEPASLKIKDGTKVIINISGLHYNPAYWDDPNEFIPGRFLDPNWNRDAFLPFLGGPRACIGRRFAETTAVTVLVRLLSKYAVTVDESKFKFIEGESMRDRRERFFNVSTKVTLTPGRIPLVFTPRR